MEGPDEKKPLNGVASIWIFDQVLAVCAESDRTVALSWLQGTVPADSRHVQRRTTLTPVAIPQTAHRALYRHAYIPGNRRTAIVCQRQAGTVTTTPVVVDVYGCRYARPRRT